MITHQHAEAFRVMTFECERCGFQELIWNSRDGLIQYTVDCPYCFGGWMRRVLEEQDLYVPEYALKPGDRKFVDLTMDRAILIAGERIAVTVLNKIAGAPQGVHEIMEKVEALAIELFGDGRQPDLITVEG